MYIYADSIQNFVKTGGTVTASTSSPYFPVSNIAGSPLACDVWRSATQDSSHTEYIRIPLGADYFSASFPNGLDLLIDSWNVDTTCTDLIVTVHASNGNSYSVPATIKKAPLRIHIPPASIDGLLPDAMNALVVVVRRLPGQTNYIEMGKMLLGVPVDTLDSNPSHGSFTRRFGEIKNSGTSVLGQNFSEKLAIYWQGNVQIPLVEESVETLIRTLVFESLGTFTPFWVIILPTDTSTSELDLPRYVKMTTPPTEKEVTYGTSFVWAISMDLTKQL